MVLFSGLCTFLPEGMLARVLEFAWAPKSQKNYDSIPMKLVLARVALLINKNINSVE
jgi:hypothetical protein